MMSYETSLKTWAILTLAGFSMLFGSRAEAFIYTVGRSGTGQNCSFANIQQAINAAAASAEDDEIWITRDVSGGYYQNQAISITNLRGTLKMVGGLDDCRDVTPDGMTELHGNGGPKAPVLEILGGDVTLTHLRFTRGDNDANDTRAGGGVAFTGAGRLDLSDVLIDRNTAGRGAGLAVTATGGRVDASATRTEVSDNNPALTFGGGIFLDARNAEIRMDALGEVRINRNYARLGGGAIAMVGRGGSSPAFVAVGARLQLEGNGTLGEGGAILAVAPALVTIGAAPLAGTQGVFVGNEALNGGAIALSEHPELGLSSGTGWVFLGSSDLGNPQVLAANRAKGQGGALYINRLRTGGSGANDSYVCSFNVGYAGNDAWRGGSAVAAIGDNASFANSPTCGVLDEFCSHLSCNQFSGHKATDDSGQPVPAGSMFWAAYSAQMDIERARVAYNTVPTLFMAGLGQIGARSTIDIDTSLIYRNTGLSASSSICEPELCRFDMTASTIVGNDFSGHVFGTRGNDFHLQESIVDQPGVRMFVSNYDPSTDPSSTLAHVVYTANYSSSIPSVRFGNPGFMNVAAMDYRLSGTSQAIDNLPARVGVDFVGRPRNIDLSSRPNGLGPRDLGAVETQHWEVGDDVILRNGFD